MILSAIAAVGASLSWATGIVIAQSPATKIGAFEFTRIQLISCGALLGLICSVMRLWSDIVWDYWLLFFISSVIGIIIGNLAMIECLRQGGPRQTELLLCLKAPAIAVLAFFWLGEKLTILDVCGITVTLIGVVIAILYNEKETEVVNSTAKDNISLVLLLGLIAAICHGLGFLVMKPVLQAGIDPLSVSAIRLLGASFLISLLALWPAQGFRPKTNMTPWLLLRIVFPGVIGYGIASTLLLYAIANLNVAIASVLGSLSPVLVLPILWFRDKKRPPVMAWLGAIIALLGVSILIVW